jgi:hypothetical protein
MNCFNIRELQSLLKWRFFTDLVNSNDHRDLLNGTILNLRYKTNGSQLIDQNITLFYNYGTVLNSPNKFNPVVSANGVSYGLNSVPLLHRLLISLDHVLYSGIGSYMEDVFIIGGVIGISDLIFSNAPNTMFNEEGDMIIDTIEDVFFHPE